MLNELLRGSSVLAKFIRYGIVGGLSSIFYGCCTWLLVQVSSLPPVVASVAGYLLAIPFSFFMQRKFAFRSGGPVRLEAPRFLLTHAINIIASICIMHVTVHVLQVDYRLGVVQTMVLIPLLSFLALNLWVFRHTENPRARG
jgi:putative flippase GtrA